MEVDCKGDRSSRRKVDRGYGVLQDRPGSIMLVLFLGDVVGKPGRRAVREYLSRIRSRRDVDLVIANGENAAGGRNNFV